MVMYAEYYLWATYQLIESKKAAKKMIKETLSDLRGYICAKKLPLCA